MKKIKMRNDHSGCQTPRRGKLRKLLSGFLAVTTAFTMMSGNAGMAIADEPFTEYALAGAGSGQDVTVHFGDGEDQHINIHVNPESNAQEETSTLAGAYSENALDAETETETEYSAETEADVENIAETAIETEAETENIAETEADVENIAETEFIAETEAETENIEETETETEAPKTEYVYEDSKVRVTATLEVPDAIPDEAEFRVTEITPDSKRYNYDAYMSALNENADSLQDQSQETAGFGEGMKVSGNKYDETNTLLYDVAFIMQSYDKEGKVIKGGEYEYQPEEGAVDIQIEFKNSQLTDDLGISNAQDVTINHLPLAESVREGVDTTADATNISAGDISVETLPADSVTLQDGGTDQAGFKMDSFSVLAISGNLSISLNADGFESISGEYVLGGSIYYGVTATDWYFDGSDSETSLAVGTWHGINGQNGSNDSKSMGAECQYILVGEIDGRLNLKGYKAYVTSPFTPDDSCLNFNSSATPEQKLENIVYNYKSKEDVQSEVQALISAAQGVSGSLTAKDSLKQEDYKGLPSGDSANKITIDFTALENGTYYINVEKFPGLQKAFENNGCVTIKKNGGQKIVFNYPTYNSPAANSISGVARTINKFIVVNNGISYDSVNLANTTTANGDIIESVIFNLPSATDVRLEDAAGIILAPQARVDTYGADGGWVICSQFYNHCEWHFTYHKVFEEGTSATFQARKRIDGNYASQNAFSFKLEKQSGEDQWDEIETVQNNQSWIRFQQIEYNSETTQGIEEFPHDFIYRITEPGEVTEVGGMTYSNDPTVYYAKVTVDKEVDGNVTRYHASRPFYYTDPACTTGTEIDTVSDFPEFDNTSGTAIRVDKKWFRGTNEISDTPEDEISFDLYRTESTTKPEATQSNGLQSSGTNSNFSGKYTDFQVNVSWNSWNEQKNVGSYSVKAGDKIHIVAQSLSEPKLSSSFGYNDYRGYGNGDIPGSVIGTRTIEITENNWTHNVTVYTKEFDYTVPTVNAAYQSWDNQPIPIDSFSLNIYFANGVWEGSYVNASVKSSHSEQTDSLTDGSLRSAGASAGDETSAQTYMSQNAARAQDGKTTWDGEAHHYTIGASDGWSRTIPNLPTVWVNSNGQTVYYSYYVVEQDGSGYTPSYENNEGIASGTIVIRNTLPEENYIRISGRKTWLDAGNALGIRPSQITVNLLQNGSIFRRTVASAEGNWAYQFDGLPEKDAQGNPYTYSVQEEAVPGYTATYEGYNIKNTGFTTINVQKQWLRGSGSGSVSDITSTKGGSITFVLKRVLYEAETGERVENSDKDPYVGGTLASASEGVSRSEDGTYTITAQSDGNSGYIWPSVSIKDLPLEVEMSSADGSQSYMRSCQYYVEETNTNGRIDAVYKLGSNGASKNKCEESNNGATVTIINQEMSFALPATGGEGTRRIYLLSLMMVMLAGTGLIMIRRRKKEVG